MSDTFDKLYSDFVTKKYENVTLDELGEAYKDKTLRVWVNPPAYTDQLARSRVSLTGDFRSLEFERWIVTTFYELDAAKVAEMPDKILIILAFKANEKYAAYQDSISK
jgi:hypothetical protein